MRITPVLFLSSLGVAAVSALLACSSNASEAPTPAADFDSGAGSVVRADSGSGSEVSPSVDAAPGDATAADDAADATTCGSVTSYCDAYVAYANACGLQKYTCDGGCGFLAKCNAFDGAINSVQRRAAETACLTAANCDTAARRDCGYRKYAEHPQTAAQQALVSQYCMTCAAGDASCATTSVTYDVSAGPLAVSAIFNAAWSFADAVTSEIATKCTGAALDAGAGGSCDAAFGACVQKVVSAHAETNLSCQ
jgi:hypothetical protein